MNCNAAQLCTAATDGASTHRGTAAADGAGELRQG